MLNKTDLLSAEQLRQLQGTLRALNPHARLVTSQFGQLPLDLLLDTGRFDFDQAAQAPGWLQTLRGEHQPESEEYGIRNFVYRARRPFHPQRFWQVVNHQMAGVLRSRGYFWLATRPEFAGVWSQAGALARQGYAGRWWVSVPREQWPQDTDSLNVIAEQWQEGTGDARQELVFIGIEMNENGLRTALNEALLTPQEMAAGAGEWLTFADPVPGWFE